MPATSLTFFDVSLSYLFLEMAAQQELPPVAAVVEDVPWQENAEQLLVKPGNHEELAADGEPEVAQVISFLSLPVSWFWIGIEFLVLRSLFTRVHDIFSVYLYLPSLRPTSPVFFHSCVPSLRFRNILNCVAGGLHRVPLRACGRELCGLGRELCFVFHLEPFVA